MQYVDQDLHIVQAKCCPIRIWLQVCLNVQTFLLFLQDKYKV